MNISSGLGLNRSVSFSTQNVQKPAFKGKGREVLDDVLYFSLKVAPRGVKTGVKTGLEYAGWGTRLSAAGLGNLGNLCTLKPAAFILNKAGNVLNKPGLKTAGDITGRVSRIFPEAIAPRLCKKPQKNKKPILEEILKRAQNQDNIH